MAAEFGRKQQLEQPIGDARWRNREPLGDLACAGTRPVAHDCLLAVVLAVRVVPLLVS
jgi:hypothetical protein